MGDLWVQLRVSLLDPGSGSGDETRLPWLSALVPKPLRKNAGCRRVGAGGSESRAGLVLQGLYSSASQHHKGMAECVWAKPPAGPSRPLPSPVSCLSTVLSSPGILRQETLPRGRKHSQAGQGKGLRLEEHRHQPDPRAGTPSQGRGQGSDRLPPSSSSPFAPSPAGKDKGA